MELFLLLMAFVVGLMSGLFIGMNRKLYSSDAIEEEEETDVIEHKVIRANLRNPMNTYSVKYEKYESKDGLYQPISPSRKGSEF